MCAKLHEHTQYQESSVTVNFLRLFVVFYKLVNLICKYGLTVVVYICMQCFIYVLVKTPQ